MRKEWQVNIKSLQQSRCEKPFTRVLENSEQITCFLYLAFLLFMPLPPSPQKIYLWFFIVSAFKTQQVLKI